MSQIEIVDFVLRGSVGGATPPEASDFLNIGSRVIGGVLIPAGWSADDLSFQCDLGGGVFETFLTVTYTGLAGTIDTFDRGQTADMLSVNRVALFPDAAEGSDLVFKLITLASMIVA